MSILEKLGYDIPPYDKVKAPARAVSKAYLDGNRYLDTCKEVVYINFGMPHFSEIIHEQAHKYLETLDKFGDMLHERHLMQEYPATEELDWEAEFTEDIESVFEFVLAVLESVQKALEEFRSATDDASLRAMSLTAEELIVENSRDYTKFMELWGRASRDKGSLTSFDNYCVKFLNCKE